MTAMSLNIVSVAVAEATLPRDGVLAPDEKLVITWGGTSPNGIASQTVTVDGLAIKAIAGPYGGRYYSCKIGTWPTGVHTYVVSFDRLDRRKFQQHWHVYRRRCGV